MKAWYLGHSGFLVETDRRFLLFDYFLDEPRGGRLEDGVNDPAQLTGKPAEIFVSHGHHDHYNPIILTWKAALPQARYFAPSGLDLPGGILLAPNREYQMGDLWIRTLPSTDEGVAFLIQCDGVCLYHAGDLNWWHWSGESETYNRRMAEHYASFLKPLAGRQIDLAFLPVDPRQEEAALWGLDYFMRQIGAKQAVPMHFWEDGKIFDRLWQDPCTRPYRDRLIGPFTRGQQLL